MQISRYLDDLDYLDKKKIEGCYHPWQKNFLIRFYKLLQKHRLRKKDIPILLDNNPDKEKLLSTGYVLPESTLSECTNFTSKNMRTVSIDTLIAISLAFGVSSDYLLGFDTLEIPDNKSPNKKMVLENEIMEYILENRDIIPDENIKQKILQLEQYKKDAANTNL